MFFYSFLKQAEHLYDHWLNSFWSIWHISFLFSSFFGDFVLFFLLECIPLPPIFLDFHVCSYELGKTATSPKFGEMILYMVSHIYSWQFPLAGWSFRWCRLRVSGHSMLCLTWWDDWSWSGCKWGSPRAFHAVDILAGQLKWNWVLIWRIWGSLGMLHRGCPCGVIGSRAGGCLCYLQGTFWWDSWCQSRHQPGGPRALYTGVVLASCLKQMWCGSGVFRDPSHLCHCDATGGAVGSAIHGVLVYTSLDPPWWDC